MREIKFRGKDFQGKWVYGDLHHKRFTAYATHMIEDSNGLGSDIHAETVGQYTGLKDKNGVYIYEGDILMEQGRTLTCKFANGGFIFCLPSGNRLTEIDTEFMRVIGNIHEQ